MRWLTLAVPFGFLLGWLLWCSPGQGHVHGQVKYQGKVVSQGSVVMVGDNRKPIVGRIETDGTYSVPGVPAGVVRIAVLSPRPGGALNSGPTGLGLRKDATRMTAKAERSRWFPLPEKYEDPDTSGLTTEIHRGDNTFDIELR